MMELKTPISDYWQIIQQLAFAGKSTNLIAQNCDFHRICPPMHKIEFIFRFR